MRPPWPTNLTGASPAPADGLLWQVSARLHDDHGAGPDGWCVTCRPRQFFPCPGRQLAVVGLRAAAPIRNAAARSCIDDARWGMGWGPAPPFAG